MLHDFEDRAREIDQLIAWMGAPAFPEAESEPPGLPADVLTTLKASVLLLLYNLVEGTTAACIQAIKDAINTSVEPFAEFSASLQLLTLRNIYMPGSSDGWHDQAVEESPGGGAIVRFAIDKRASYFSGNLDLQALQKMLGRFGISISDEISQRVDGAFGTVKIKRNALAHGDASFSNVGRDFTTRDLRGFADHIVAGMRAVAAEVGDFVAERRFLAPASPV